MDVMHLSYTMHIESSMVDYTTVDIYIIKKYNNNSKDLADFTWKD
jgi:hypothetical protein